LAGLIDSWGMVPLRKTGIYADKNQRPRGLHSALLSRSAQALNPRFLHVSKHRICSLPCLNYWNLVCRRLIQYASNLQIRNL
jgi:hypothetical protein